MRPPSLTGLLLIAAGAVATAGAFVVAPVKQRQQWQQPRLHHLNNRNTQQQQLQHAATAPRRLHPQRQPLRVRQDEGPEDELQRLMDRLLSDGRERDLEAWERRRRLQIQQEEEQGIMGKVRAFGKKLAANLPVLFFAPLVMLAAVQLSSIAVTTAVVAALVVASFSLPVVALAFLVPVAIFLLLGTLAFPIVPFAVFTIAPSLIVLPLFMFLGWLVFQVATGPTVIREDSLFNSFGGFPFLDLDLGDEDDDVGNGRGRGPRGPGRRDDGVIDVKAEEDTDAEAEEALRRFDERLRGGGGRDGDGKWW